MELISGRSLEQPMDMSTGQFSGEPIDRSPNDVDLSEYQLCRSYPTSNANRVRVVYITQRSEQLFGVSLLTTPEAVRLEQKLRHQRFWEKNEAQYNELLAKAEANLQ